MASGNAPINAPSLDCAASAPSSPPVTSTKPPLPPVRIRVYLFFDGTLNNLFNTAERERYSSSEYKASALDIPWYDFGARTYRRQVGNSKSSYANELTNVAWLFKFAPPERDEDTEKEFSLYIEGIGTSAGGGDSMRGSAFGRGDTGIPARVSGAVERIVSNIERRVRDKQRSLAVELFAFGFSRGAAAARHFVHQVLNGVNGLTLQQRLTERHGFSSVNSVTVKFVGLFDTVASYASAFELDFTNDTRQLDLDAVSKAGKVVHLASADEHRKNFALTNIKSCGSNGTEVFLPGVHSDIGGGYTDNIDQVQSMLFMLPYNPRSVARGASVGEGADSMMIYSPYFREQLARETREHEMRLQKEINWFLEQGWCEVQSNCSESASQSSISICGTVLIASRKGLRNNYCWIPLRIMKDFAIAAGVAIQWKGMLELQTPLDSALGGVVVQDGKTVEQYLAWHASQGTSTAESWKTLAPQPWLKSLRQSYFHFSANYDDFGMGPQFRSLQHGWGTEWNQVMHGERERRVLDG